LSYDIAERNEPLLPSSEQFSQAHDDHVGIGGGKFPSWRGDVSVAGPIKQLKYSLRFTRHCEEVG
jgi:hypothetical protein